MLELLKPYKNKAKKLKRTIPFKKQSMYRKIIIVILIGIDVLEMLLLALNRIGKTFLILYLLSLIAIFTGLKIDSKSENQEILKSDFYKVYDVRKQHILLGILYESAIDYGNKKCMDILISEVKESIDECSNTSLKKLNIIKGAFNKFNKSFIERFGIDLCILLVLRVLISNIIMLRIVLLMMSILYDYYSNSFNNDYYLYTELLSDLKMIEHWYVSKGRPKIII
mgnify:CR=1 FL=1